MILNWCNKGLHFHLLILLPYTHFDEKKVRKMNQFYFDCQQAKLCDRRMRMTEWVNEWEYVAYFIHKLVYLCVMSIYHFSQKEKKKEKKK